MQLNGLGVSHQCGHSAHKLEKIWQEPAEGRASFPPTIMLSLWLKWKILWCGVKTNQRNKYIIYISDEDYLQWLRSRYYSWFSFVFFNKSIFFCAYMWGFLWPLINLWRSTTELPKLSEVAQVDAIGSATILSVSTNQAKVFSITRRRSCLRLNKP